MIDCNNEEAKKLNAVPLTKSKEWNRTHTFNNLKGRQVYWSWKDKVYTIKHICPMTLQVWFTENYNGLKSDTNAIQEMYLLPKN